MPARTIPSQSQFLRYAQALAATVFADKKFVSGQQLLEALPQKQLNLLVLYRLKERWEEEASAIRSPFFDYDAPPVRDAQRKFLNVLSQHIRLQQDAYTDLLVQALQDAWQLASKPAQFLASLAEKLSKTSITVEQMQTVGKYIAYHGDLLRQALKDLGLTGRTTFLKGDLYRQLQQIEDRQPAAGKNAYLDELSFYLSTLGVEEREEPTIITEPEPPAEPAFALEASLPDVPEYEEYTAYSDAQTTEAESKVDIIDTEQQAAWPLAHEESQSTSAEGLLPEPETAHLPTTSSSESVVYDIAEAEASVEVEPIWQQEPTPEPTLQKEAIFPQEPAPLQASVMPDFAPPSFLSSEEKEESLGDRLARQQQGQALYNKVSAAGSENLHSIIAIGDRYMMVGQLFGGDMASYSMAVSHVNGLDDFQSALHYLWDEIAPRNNWNPDSDAYKTLEAALRRKFAA